MLVVVAEPQAVNACILVAEEELLRKPPAEQRSEVPSAVQSLWLLAHKGDLVETALEQSSDL